LTMVEKLLFLSQLVIGKHLQYFEMFAEQFQKNLIKLLGKS